VYGLDISKDVFDIYNGTTVHYQLKHDSSGFKSLLKSLPKSGLPYDENFVSKLA